MTIFVSRSMISLLNERMNEHGIERMSWQQRPILSDDVVGGQAAGGSRRRYEAGFCIKCGEA